MLHGTCGGLLSNAGKTARTTKSATRSEKGGDRSVYTAILLRHFLKEYSWNAFSPPPLPHEALRPGKLRHRPCANRRVSKECAHYRSTDVWRRCRPQLSRAHGGAGVRGGGAQGGGGDGRWSGNLAGGAHERTVQRWCIILYAVFLKSEQNPREGNTNFCPTSPTVRRDLARRASAEERERSDESERRRPRRHSGAARRRRGAAVTGADGSAAAEGGVRADNTPSRSSLLHSYTLH